MTPALKEWSAAVHALLDGRQKVLLRKGGASVRSDSRLRRKSFCCFRRWRTATPSGFDPSTGIY